MVSLIRLIDSYWDFPERKTNVKAMKWMSLLFENITLVNLKF